VSGTQKKKTEKDNLCRMWGTLPTPKATSAGKLGKGKGQGGKEQRKREEGKVGDEEEEGEDKQNEVTKVMEEG